MLDAMILLVVLTDRCDLLIVCAAVVSLSCCMNPVHCKTTEHDIGPASTVRHTILSLRRNGKIAVHQWWNVTDYISALVHI